jgi:hypothetical protein
VKDNEESVRKRLARDLGERNLPSYIWGDSAVADDFKELLDYEEHQPEYEAIYGYLLKSVGRIWDAYRQGRDDGQAGSNQAVPMPSTRSDIRQHTPVGRMIDLPIDERARASISADVTAWRAWRVKSVERFRNRFLSQSLLVSDEQVIKFISTPALGMLSCDALLEAGEDLSAYEWELDAVTRPDGSLAIQATTKTGNTVVREYTSIPGADDLRVLRVRLSDGVTSKGDCRLGSLLDELRLIGEELNRLFTWDPADGVRFVLTGDPPKEVPLIAWIERTIGDQRVRARITLDVDPAISAETVTKAYRQVQGILLRRAGMESRGGKKSENRQPSAKATELFRFVEEWSVLSTRRPPFARLALEWGRQHPEMAYAQSGKFIQAYRSAANKLMTPDYYMLDDPPYDSIKKAPRYSKWRLEPVRDRTLPLRGKRFTAATDPTKSPPT